MQRITGMGDSIVSETRGKIIEENYARIGKWLAHPAPGDEIVISGVTGRFPESANIHEFQKNLYHKIDMVSDKTKRYGKIPPNVPQRTGEMSGMNKFDCGYFGISKEVANVMDPASRIQLEAATEAILDAGVNPVELQGTNTEVFIATGHAESQPLWFRDDLKKKNSLLGSTRSVSAHRISHHLKLNGPSCTLDSACSSTLYALREAYNHIRTGKIDAAIVGGVTIILNPSYTYSFKLLGVLSSDGICKAFDESADGYVRSEAAGAIFMQKAKDSRRAYAKIVHASVNCAGYNDQGITYPSETSQMELMMDFYRHCDISPSSVEFVEAHGTGTVGGDMVEISSLEKTFCSEREDSLLLGAVKSNMGHSEISAAHCQIIKSILVMESGLIPPNLHIKKALDLNCFRKERIKLPTEVTPFKDMSGRIAINSYGFGGANGHCMLEWNKKEKLSNGIRNDGLPRLICVSGRCEASVTNVLDHVKKGTLDFEFFSLLHQMYKHTSSLDVYRGFSIVTTNGEITRTTVKHEINKSKIGIMFCGIGFPRNTNDFLNLRPVRSVLERMNKIISSEGLSSKYLMNNSMPYNGGLDYTAFQIVTYEIFQALGLECEFVPCCEDVELLQAYANKKVDLKQALLMTLYKENMQNKNLNGGVGGLLEYHSKKKNNACILKNNSRRTPLFPSTSVLLHFGKDNKAFENGLLVNSSEEVMWHNVNLEDGVASFLRAIGRLYLMGHNPDIAKLYPEIQYPVSRGTSMISPLLRWDHREDWFVLSFRLEDQPDVFSLKFAVDTKDSEWNYMTGHVIDGRKVFPASGYLFFVWKMFSIMRKVYFADMHIIFEDVKFLQEYTLMDEITEFVVSIQPNSGSFVVIGSDIIIVTGTIRTAKNTDEKLNVNYTAHVSQPSAIKLLKKDIYKELRLRGYDEVFEGIDEYYPDSSLGYIHWVDENWIVLMDLIWQIYILSIERRKLYVPKHIQRIRIDAPNHLKFVSNYGKLPVYICANTRCIQSGFVQIKGIYPSEKQRRYVSEPLLHEYKFIPNETALSIEESIAINMQIIVENYNSVKLKVLEVIDKISASDPLAPLIKQALSELPLIQPEVIVLSPLSLNIETVKVENRKLGNMSGISVIVAENLVGRNEVRKEALACLTENGFLVSREPLNFTANEIATKCIDIITIHRVSSETLVLLRRKRQPIKPQVIDMSWSSEKNGWMDPLKKAVSNDKHVILYAENDQLNGITGFLNCLRKEPGGENVICVFMQDSSAPPFSIEHEFYRNVIRKRSTINIYKDGQWGTYRHIKLKAISHKAYNNCFVGLTGRGDLSSLSWLEGPSQYQNERNLAFEIINVHYSAVSFKDILFATKKLPSLLLKNRNGTEGGQGMEFSGKNERGERVMGLCESGSHTTCLDVSKCLILPVPDNWTLEDAATVPVAYATALYAFSKTKLKAGQSILIQSGTGSIGHAALNLALHYRLNVFTTVGSHGKREYIRRRYPQIQETHIGYSRDTSFEQLIHKETQGRGVDIVLNSLGGPKLLASLRCLAFGGTFLELGKYDLLENNPLRLNLLKKNAAFHGVSLVKFVGPESRTKHWIMQMIADGIDNGSVMPLRRTCFGADEVEKAYRYMSSDKHIGKVLIKIRDDHSMTDSLVDLTERPKALARYYCYSKYSYVIVGGLGGIGLELADWLVTRGARKLVLSSRRGVRTGYQQSRIRIWRKLGCKVIVSTADLSVKGGCEALLKKAEELAPVVAVFNLAAVLLDAVFENQTAENFRDCLNPKAKWTIHLDELSRNICPKLKDFVVFSSVTCGKGKAGQTNYGMANSIIERICEKRRRDNLPALAIQWAAIGDVGILSEMQKGNKEIEIEGTIQQKIRSCLEVMDRFMTGDSTITSSMVIAEKGSTANSSYNLVETVARMLGITDLKTVSLNSTLPELGMDSVVYNEIKQFLEREMDIFLTASETRRLTFARLHEIMSENTKEEASGRETEVKAAQLRDTSTHLNTNEFV